MLVLKREEGERILIGDDITVVICRTGKRFVKIGIEAPKHVRVMREELVRPPVAEAACEVAPKDLAGIDWASDSYGGASK